MTASALPFRDARPLPPEAAPAGPRPRPATFPPAAPSTDQAPPDRAAARVAEQPISDPEAAPVGVSPHPVMVTITALMVVGVVMVYSALAGLEGPAEDTPWYKLTSFRAMLFAPIAFVVMLACSRLPYRRLDGRLVLWLGIAALVLLVLVYMPGIGVEKNFRRRWIKIPGLPDAMNLGFQPSEIAKFCVVVLMAWWFSRPGGEPGSWRRGFLPAAGIMGLFAAVIAKEDLGTGIIVGAVSLAMMVAGGCRLWHPLTLVPVVLVIGLVTMDETRWNRLLRWLREDHQLDVLGKDYQSIMGERAIASGGIGGQGLGEGYLKLGFLPLKSSDFIFCHISEELGVAGAGAILAVYGVLLWQGGLIMTRAADRFGQLIAFGITFIFGLQAFIHAGVATKLLPNKGINLPFVSAGGTGLIIMAAAGGLLAAVARESGRRRRAGEESATPLGAGVSAGSGEPPQQPGAGAADVAATARPAGLGALAGVGATALERFLAMVGGGSSAAGGPKTPVEAFTLAGVGSSAGGGSAPSSAVATSVAPAAGNPGASSDAPAPGSAGKPDGEASPKPLALRELPSRPLGTGAAADPVAAPSVGAAVAVAPAPAPVPPKTRIIITPGGGIAHEPVDEPESASGSEPVAPLPTSPAPAAVPAGRASDATAVAVEAAAPAPAPSTPAPAADNVVAEVAPEADPDPFDLARLADGPRPADAEPLRDRRRELQERLASAFARSAERRESSRAVSALREPRTK